LQGWKKPSQFLQQKNNGFAAIARKQLNYAEKHAIHPGWLLYRTKNEYAKKAQSQYVTGKVETWDITSAIVKGFIVEEEFIRSCLLDVEIDSFVNTDANNIYNNKTMQSRFSRKGLFPTGSLRCKY